MTTPESQVINACMHWLYWRKIFAWRNNSGSYKTDKGNYIKYGFPGSSDIIGVLPGGRFLAVECKAGKNNLQESQIAFKKKIENSGGLYVIARSTDDLEKALKDYLPPRGPG